MCLLKILCHWTVHNLPFYCTYCAQRVSFGHLFVHPMLKKTKNKNKRTQKHYKQDNIPQGWCYSWWISQIVLPVLKSRNVLVSITNLIFTWNWIDNLPSSASIKVFIYQVKKKIKDRIKHQTWLGDCLGALLSTPSVL